MSTRARVLRERAAAGELWIDVDGPSMRPTIEPPASVLVVAADRPRAGEVWAAVDREGAVVVHRVVRRYSAPGWYCLRGDAESDDDPPMPAERLVGRVRTVRDGRGERHVGRSAGRVAAAQLRRARRLVRRLLRRRHPGRSDP